MSKTLKEDNKTKKKIVFTVLSKEEIENDRCKAYDYLF